MSTQIRKTPSQALVRLSENLQSIKEKNEWTQAQLGEWTGIGQKNAGRILNQEVEPTLATLSQIAERLKKPEPLLLCPGMNADELVAKSTIRAPLRDLITALVTLDNEGNLTDQVLKTIHDVLAIAVPKQVVTQNSDKSRIVGAR